MRLRYLSMNILCLFLVVSCGGGSGAGTDEVAPVEDTGTNQEEAGNTHFSGFIGIEESGRIAIASFSIAGRAPTVFEMEHESCLPFATDIVSFTPGANNTVVTAGESVILDSDAGTYATLPLVDDDSDYPSYRQSDLPAGSDSSMPNSLTLITTGDGDFPASSINIPDIDDLSLVEATDSPLVSGIYQWVPSATVEDDIVIRIFYNDSISGEFSSYTCRATDDGYFELPEAVATATSGAVNSGGIYRQRVNIIIEQDISWFARRTNGVFLN